MGETLDTQGFAFNRDDERAQRLSGLALMLMNATSPVTSTAIRATLYPERAYDAFERAFLRDRGTLAELGLAVEQVDGGAGEEATWRLDPLATVQTSGLTDEEALVVDIMCRPLCSDPTFPFGADLMMALAKVNNSFEDVLPQAQGVTLTEMPRPAMGLRAAFLCRVGCDVTYEDAMGRVSSRRVAPLGTFGLRENLYFVTCPVGPEGLDDAHVRLLRADRVVSASPVHDLPFELPEDFCVDDHVRLPFQIGSAAFTARFLVPSEAEREVRAAVGSSASLVPSDRGLVLEAEAADLGAAAAWAVAEGVIPLSPDELVRAVRAILEGACGNGR